MKSARNYVKKKKSSSSRQRQGAAGDPWTSVVTTFRASFYREKTRRFGSFSLRITLFIYSVARSKPTPYKRCHVRETTHTDTKSVQRQVSCFVLHRIREPVLIVVSSSLLFFFQGVHLPLPFPILPMSFWLVRVISLDALLLSHCLISWHRHFPIQLFSFLFFSFLSLLSFFLSLSLSFCLFLLHPILPSSSLPPNTSGAYQYRIHLDLQERRDSNS